MKDTQTLEYLYWYKNGELHHFIGTSKPVYIAVISNKAAPYYCYGAGYQFAHPWYTLTNDYGVHEIIPSTRVPPEILALHLLIYRGDHD